MSRAEAPSTYSPRYVHYVVFLIFLVAVFNVCDRTILSVLVDDIRTDLALDDRQMGFVLGFAFSITYLLAGVPLARLADRASRRKIIAASLVVWSLFTAATGLAQHYVQLVLVRMGVGLGEAGGSPPSHSLLTDYVEPHRRARAMSMLSIGAIVGLGGGVLYGGWAGDAMGWRWALISVGLPGMVLGWVFLWTVEDPPRRVSDLVGEDHYSEKNLLGVLLQLVRTPAFVYLTMGASFISAVSVGRSLWEPTFLRRVYGMSAAEAGIWFFGISAIPSGVGAYLGATVIDRLAQRDRRWYAWVPAIASILLVPLGLAFYLYPEDRMLSFLPVAFVFSIASSLVGACWAPATMAVAQNIVPPAARSVCAATWSMIANFVGQGLGPYLVGDFNVRLAETHGDLAIRYSLALVSLGPLLAAWAYWRLSKHLTPPKESQPGRALGNPRDLTAPS
jgi:MFS family permease